MTNVRQLPISSLHPAKTCGAPREFRSKPWAEMACRLAAAVVLVAASGSATTPERAYSHPDLVHTYDFGLVTEARVLARAYLTAEELRFREAKSDADRSAAATWMTGTVGSVLSQEKQYPLGGRFRNSMDLLTQLERALATAESAPIASEGVEIFRSFLGGVCTDWLGATQGIKSRADQAEFIHRHAVSLKAVRAPSLDAFIEYSNSGRSKVTGAQGQQIAELVQRFARGYATRDAAEVASTTDLDRAVVSSRMAAGGLRSLVGTSRRVAKIAIGSVAEAYISALDQRGVLFLVYLPDVLLQLEEASGTATPEKVDRVLTVVRHDGGALKIIMFADRSQAGGKQ